jgi:hypothetical protein
MTKLPITVRDAAIKLAAYVEAVQTVLAVYSSPSDQPKDYEAMHSVPRTTRRCIRSCARCWTTRKSWRARR